MKGVHHFGIKGKLTPHYIGPYPILEKYGPLAYQVELTSRLFSVHNVFHVSQLKRCLKPSMDVVIKDNIPLEPDLTYKCYPIKVLDQQDRATQRRLFNFIRLNGMIIQKMKPLARVKTISAPTTLTSCHQGKRSEPRPTFFPSTLISRRYFF
jgi:hypothetical protein